MNEFKIKKFRDTRDYRNDQVYNWKQDLRRKGKRVTWAEGTFSDLETTDDEDLAGIQRTS